MFTIIGGDGKEYGPVSVERLREWIKQNRANLNTQARREGGFYQPLREHPEFAPPPPPPAPAAAASPTAATGEGVVQPDAGPAPVGAAAVAPAAPVELPTVEPAAAEPAATVAPAEAPAGAAAVFSAAQPPPPPPPGGALAAPPFTPVAKAPPEPIAFTGEWKEYFKIWIVNVLLTIATLGIYAAWAKVRKRRYFYANTRVCGHAFEYLADPAKILIGNLIVVALFGLYAVSPNISLFLYGFMVLVLLVLTPWFIMRATAFNARNTAWRGLRFNFQGGYGGAAAAFLGWPMLIGCTMFLLFPLVTQKQKEYLVRHLRFGATPFLLRTELMDFFKAFLVAALFFLPLVIAYFAFIAFAVMDAVKRQDPNTPPDFTAMGTAAFVLFGVAMAAAFIGTQFWRARVFNIVWNGASIGGHSFVANMRAWDLIKLQVVNSLVSLVTFGFLHPWAVVRKVRFQLSCLQVVPAGDLDAFVAESQAAGSAVGDAAGDLFDFDVGFGV